METKHNLSPATEKALQELIEINVDSCKGFHKAASLMTDQDLARLFERIGGQRRSQAHELAELIRVDDPLQSSFKGKMHRWWMDLRTSLSGDEALSVLEEAERGEDEIKARYEQLLKENAGNAASDLLHRQYVAVKEGHDQIRDIRDRARNAAEAE